MDSIRRKREVSNSPDRERGYPRGERGRQEEVKHDSKSKPVYPVLSARQILPTSLPPKTYFSNRQRSTSREHLSSSRKFLNLVHDGSKFCLVQGDENFDNPSYDLDSNSGNGHSKSSWPLRSQSFDRSSQRSSIHLCFPEDEDIRQSSTSNLVIPELQGTVVRDAHLQKLSNIENNYNFGKSTQDRYSRSPYGLNDNRTNFTPSYAGYSVLSERQQNDAPSYNNGTSSSQDYKAPTYESSYAVRQSGLYPVPSQTYGIHRRSRSGAVLQRAKKFESKALQNLQGSNEMLSSGPRTLPWSSWQVPPTNHSPQKVRRDFELSNLHKTCSSPSIFAMAAEGSWKVGEKRIERHSTAFATKQSPPLPPKDRHMGHYTNYSPYNHDRRSSETNSFDSRTGSSADLYEPPSKHIPTTLQDESLIPRRGSSTQNIESLSHNSVLHNPALSLSPKKSVSPSKPPTGKAHTLSPKRGEIMSTSLMHIPTHQRSPSFNRVDLNDSNHNLCRETAEDEDTEIDDDSLPEMEEWKPENETELLNDDKHTSESSYLNQQPRPPPPRASPFNFSPPRSSRTSSENERLSQSSHRSWDADQKRRDDPSMMRQPLDKWNDRTPEASRPMIRIHHSPEQRFDSKNSSASQSPIKPNFDETIPLREYQNGSSYAAKITLNSRSRSQSKSSSDPVKLSSPSEAIQYTVSIKLVGTSLNESGLNLDCSKSNTDKTTGLEKEVDKEEIRKSCSKSPKLSERSRPTFLDVHKEEMPVPDWRKIPIEKVDKSPTFEIPRFPNPIFQRQGDILVEDDSVGLKIEELSGSDESSNENIKFEDKIDAEISESVQQDCCEGYNESLVQFEELSDRSSQGLLEESEEENSNNTNEKSPEIDANKALEELESGQFIEDDNEENYASDEDNEDGVEESISKEFDNIIEGENLTFLSEQDLKNLKDQLQKDSPLKGPYKTEILYKPPMRFGSITPVAYEKSEICEVSLLQPESNKCESASRCDEDESFETCSSKMSEEKQEVNDLEPDEVVEDKAVGIWDSVDIRTDVDVSDLEEEEDDPGMPDIEELNGKENNQMVEAVAKSLPEPSLVKKYLTRLEKELSETESEDESFEAFRARRSWNGREAAAPERDINEDDTETAEFQSKLRHLGSGGSSSSATATQAQKDSTGPGDLSACDGSTPDASAATQSIDVTEDSKEVGSSHYEREHEIVRSRSQEIFLHRKAVAAMAKKKMGLARGGADGGTMKDAIVVTDMPVEEEEEKSEIEVLVLKSKEVTPPDDLNSKEVTPPDDLKSKEVTPLENTLPENLKATVKNHHEESSPSVEIILTNVSSALIKDSCPSPVSERPPSPEMLTKDSKSSSTSSLHSLRHSRSFDSGLPLSPEIRKKLSAAGSSYKSPSDISIPDLKRVNNTSTSSSCKQSVEDLGNSVENLREKLLLFPIGRPSRTFAQIVEDEEEDTVAQLPVIQGGLIRSRSWQGFGAAHRAARHQAFWENQRYEQVSDKDLSLPPPPASKPPDAPPSILNKPLNDVNLQAPLPVGRLGRNSAVLRRYRPLAGSPSNSPIRNQKRSLATPLRSPLAQPPEKSMSYDCELAVTVSESQSVELDPVQVKKASSLCNLMGSPEETSLPREDTDDRDKVTALADSLKNLNSSGTRENRKMNNPTVLPPSMSMDSLMAAAKVVAAQFDDGQPREWSPKKKKKYPTDRSDFLASSNDEADSSSDEFSLEIVTNQKEDKSLGQILKSGNGEEEDPADGSSEAPSKTVLDLNQQILLRQHYLSIIQEEEEHSDATGNTPGSSRASSRPNSIYGGLSNLDSNELRELFRGLEESGIKTNCVSPLNRQKFAKNSDGSFSIKVEREFPSIPRSGLLAEPVQEPHLSRSSPEALKDLLKKLPPPPKQPPSLKPLWSPDRRKKFLPDVKLSMDVSEEQQQIIGPDTSHPVASSQNILSDLLDPIKDKPVEPVQYLAGGTNFVKNLSLTEIPLAKETDIITNDPCPACTCAKKTQNLSEKVTIQSSPVTKPKPVSLGKPEFSKNTDSMYRSNPLIYSSERESLMEEGHKKYSSQNVSRQKDRELPTSILSWTEKEASRSYSSSRESLIKLCEKPAKPVKQNDIKLCSQESIVSQRHQEESDSRTGSTYSLPKSTSLSLIKSDSGSCRPSSYVRVERKMIEVKPKNAPSQTKFVEVSSSSKHFQALRDPPLQHQNNNNDDLLGTKTKPLIKPKPNTYTLPGPRILENPVSSRTNWNQNIANDPEVRAKLIPMTSKAEMILQETEEPSLEDLIKKYNGSRKVITPMTVAVAEQEKISSVKVQQRMRSSSCNRQNLDQASASLDKQGGKFSSVREILKNVVGSQRNVQQQKLELLQKSNLTEEDKTSGGSKMTRFFKSAFGGGNTMSGGSKQQPPHSKAPSVSYSNTSLVSETNSETFAKVVPTTTTSAPKSKSGLQKSEGFNDSHPQSSRFDSLHRSRRPRGNEAR